MMAHAAHRRHRRDALRGRDRAHEERDRVLPAELPHRHEPAAAVRHPRRARAGGHRPRACGAATTRTRRARSPFTREHLRQVMGAPRAGADPADRRRQQRRALRLRPRRAAAGRRQVRPDGRRDRRAAHRRCRRARTRRSCARPGTSRRRADVRMRLEPEDDLFHAPDDDQNYNESRYYNFFDPNASSAGGLGGWVRMGNRPNEQLRRR